MEFLSAFSGLERIAIIGGAIVIGYWGFRLFASDRIPGLVFMGVACAVLIAVLMTSDDHVASLSSSLQPNTLPAAQPETAAATAPETLTNAPTPSPQAAESGRPLPRAKAQGNGADSGSDTAADASSATPGMAAEPPAAPSDVLGGRDLDGRIISVKSENLTLEWTPPSE